MSTDRGPARGTEDFDIYKWWWPQEIPSAEEWNNAYENLERYQWTVDFIITHDTPANITMKLNKDYRLSKVSKELEIIEGSTDYLHWFCGHMHVDEDFGDISILYRSLPTNVEIYIDGESETKEKRTK